MHKLVFCPALRAGLLAVWGAAAIYAQAQSPPAPTTREAEFELLRRQKVQVLEPETNPKIEHVLNVIKEKRLVERFTQGVNGVRFRFGGLPTGSGFALGPEFYKRNVLVKDGLFRTSVRGSLKRYYLMETELSLPSLGDGKYFADFYAARIDAPRIEYYGQGSESARTGRSDFRLENTWVQSSAGIEPVEDFRIGGLVKYMAINVGPGTDSRYISSDRIYTERTTPGIQIQTNFAQYGGFAEYDRRDYPGGPRHGGLYRADFSEFHDTDGGLFSFHRLDLEAQQYIPFFNDRRVIALRGRIQAADPRGGARVPFYLQPTLGGSQDLRGYRQFRFYDNASLVMNGEYRWEVFSGLDMALFADAGRVFPKWQSISLHELESDVGFGFRFNVRNSVFLRIDTAFSHEGFGLWIKFNNVF